MRIRLTLAVPVLAGVAVLFGAPAASANNGALVIRDVPGICGVLDGNGNVVAVAQTHWISNHAGNVNQVCSGNVSPSASGKSVTWDFANTGLMANPSFDGVSCPLTTNWSETVTPDGRDQFTAHVTGCS